MFDKFIEDLEKRSQKNKNHKNASKKSIEEEEAKRLRNLLYNERWQNRIVWSNHNEQ